MSKFILNQKCGLCGFGRQKLLFRSSGKNAGQTNIDVGITSDVYGSYENIIICADCGFVHQSPPPDANDLLNAYRNLKDETYTDEDDCRSINAHLCLRSIRRHQTKGALLDIGCSTGMFLNAARLNFDVYGVEPSKWASEYAKNTLKLGHITNDTFEHADISKEYFDVISLIDVIEHVIDAKSALKKARELLKPGGLLYIVTPDIKSLSARLLGRYWWGLRQSHVSYFSKKTITNLLSELGFAVIELKSYGRIFAYKYWLSRIRRYPSFFYNCAKLVGKYLKIEDKVIYINTRDSIELCAIKNK